MENQVNVFDISRNLSWPLLRLVIVYTMTSQGSSQIEAVNFRNMEFQIYFLNF